ncbi:MAG: hypothetical protein LR011_12325 [Verrucomicrobia bacterium]|nr:hypothetical protein [Verrucomicrobiota bacterium]
MKIDLLAAQGSMKRSACLWLLSLMIASGAPEDWNFAELTLDPGLRPGILSIGNDGSVAFSGERIDAEFNRIESGVYYKESADAAVVPIALTGEDLPGGLGTMGFFVENVRIDPNGRVLIQVDIENVGGAAAVLRWDKGEITRMLPDDRDFVHQLDYLTSDGRWIVEDLREPFRDSNAILTDGSTFVRLPQGFGPQSLNCGEAGRTHAVPNAKGNALFMRYRFEDTEFFDENGQVVSCGAPTKSTWSLSTSGAEQKALVSGTFAKGFQIPFISSPRDAHYLYNDAGEALFLRDRFSGFQVIQRDLIRTTSTGGEQVLVSSLGFGTSTPLLLLGWDSARRIAFSTNNGLIAGPDAEADRVIAVADSLFGSAVVNVNAIAVAGPENSTKDLRKFLFFYTLEDGRNGYAMASRVGSGTGDRDGDGLLDEWESEGGGIDVNGDGIIDLDLFALGARPDHKDLFVEVDATLAQTPINPRSLPMVVEAFRNAPVQNPDKTTGIQLHLEIDETGIIPEQGVSSILDMPHGFRLVTKPRHFGTQAQRDHPTNAEHILAAKRLAFRYAMIYAFVDFGTSPEGKPLPGYLGKGEIGGNDFVINLGGKTMSDGYRDAEDQAATFMHELGHTLGLHHGGGFDEVIGHEQRSWQGKPNYPSIMNYSLSHPHRWSARFWKLDYSREALPDLDERSLDELKGINSTQYRNFLMPYGTGPAGRRVMRLARLNGSRVDFNHDRAFSGNVQADLNFIGTAAGFPGVDQATPNDTMKGHNDWANLQYAVVDRDGNLDGDLELSDGCPTPEIHEYLETSVPVIADTYDDWIASLTESGPGSIPISETGFRRDPDGDGVPNGLERYLGTSPARPSPGLVPVMGAPNGSSGMDKALNQTYRSWRSINGRPT